MSRIPEDVRVASRKVKETIGFNSLGIRDTDYHFSDPIDVSDSLNKAVLVYNTLNQPVKIGVDVNVGGVWNGAGSTFVTVPANNGGACITGADLKLLGQPVMVIRLYALCDVAPTVGSLNALVERD